MKRLRLAGTVALLLCGAFGAAYGQSITYLVDCAGGQKVADALARGDAKKPLVIVVRGTCEESITIARDDVTIRGDESSALGGGLYGPVPSVDTVVITADRVTLSRLTVSGGNIGVRIQGNYNATLDQVTVRDTGARGVLARSGTLEFTNSTIENAGAYGLYLTRGAAARLANAQVLETNGPGIYVDSNSTLTISSSTIRSNASAGVQFYAGAHGFFSNTTIDSNGTNPSMQGSGVRVGGSHVVFSAGNTITHNREHGILAEAAATLTLDQSTITDNGRSGVMGYLGANLVLHGNTIARNGEYGVYCRAHCTAQLGGATIEQNGVDGIAIMLGSVLIFEEPTTQSVANTGWGVWCGDQESSVDGLQYLNGTVFEGCTGFRTTQVVAGLIYKTGASSVVTPYGFTSERLDVGTYEIRFPAGTFSTFPMVTVTPARGVTGPDTPFAIARIEQVTYSPETGAAIATVRLSSTSPAVTPIDQGFYFIAAESVPAPAGAQTVSGQ
jgi:hypothetical protein